MIKIKEKLNNNVVEQINNNDYFNIDKDFIYIKDEFNNIIKFDRRVFYSEMDLDNSFLKSK